MSLLLALEKLETRAVVTDTIKLKPTALESKVDTMSAEHSSLYASSAFSSSDAVNGFSHQGHALRRNSFDMVIAVANARAADDSRNGTVVQPPIATLDESNPYSPVHESYTRAQWSRKSKPFDIESQTGSF